MEQQEYIHRYRDPERFNDTRRLRRNRQEDISSLKDTKCQQIFRGLGLNAFQSNSSHVVELPRPFHEPLYQSPRSKRCAVSKNSDRSYLSPLSEDISVSRKHLQEIISRKNILWQIHHRSRQTSQLGSFCGVVLRLFSEF